MLKNILDVKKEKLVKNKILIINIDLLAKIFYKAHIIRTKTNAVTLVRKEK